MMIYALDRGVQYWFNENASAQNQQFMVWSWGTTTIIIDLLTKNLSVEGHIIHEYFINAVDPCFHILNFHRANSFLLVRTYFHFQSLWNFFHLIRTSLSYSGYSHPRSIRLPETSKEIPWFSQKIALSFSSTFCSGSNKIFLHSRWIPSHTFLSPYLNFPGTSQSANPWNKTNIPQSSPAQPDGTFNYPCWACKFKNKSYNKIINNSNNFFSLICSGTK